MSKELFGLIAIALVIATYVPFIYQIIKGHVKPHPFSWLIWSVTSASICTLQLINGAGMGAYPSGVVCFFALIVTILSFKNGKVPIQKMDIICLITAAVGLATWLIIQQPAISIALILFVDVIGFIPTLTKAWRAPYEDSLTLWGISFSRHTTSLFAIQNYNFITLLNPFVWMALTSTICAVLLTRRRHFTKAKGRKRIFRPHV